MSKRRGSGEGSIYKRKSDGRWAASVTLGYHNGVRVRKVVYGDTRKAVALELKTLLHSQQQGVPLATDKQTVEQFLHRWLADVIQPTTRPNTYVVYERMLRLHIIPTLGTIRLTKLTAQDVQRTLTQVGQAGTLSARTVRFLRQILSMALEQAVRWRLIPYNAAALATSPKTKEHAAMPTCLTPVQARQLLHTVRDDRLEALYHVALALGLRRGELLGLRWQDIDFEQNTLRVDVQLQQVPGQLIQLVPPKSQSSRRLLPLSTSLATTLRAHKTRQLQERLLLGLAWQDTWNLVFPTSIGTPMRSQNLWTHFRTLLQRADLPLVNFHSLRHSCASLLAAQGVPDRVAMEILGHAGLAMTQHYQHTMPGATREAAERIEQILAEDVG